MGAVQVGTWPQIRSVEAAGRQQQPSTSTTPPTPDPSIRASDACTRRSGGRHYALRVYPTERNGPSGSPQVDGTPTHAVTVVVGLSPTKGFILAGKHAAAPSTPEGGERSHLRRLLPVIAGVAVVLTLIGGGATVLTLRGSSHTTATRSASPEPSDLASSDDRSSDRADRANRGQLAEPSPTSASPTTPPPQTPTQTPTSTPPPSKTATPTAEGSAASSGTCKASYYATGTTTANGEAYNPDGITAAHKTLPFNTRVRVTNLANSSSVIVRINDRGPFVSGRCLDLSRGAFKSIASLNAGVLSVKYEVLA